MILANSDENTNTRRSFLRGAAGAAAAATGATAFSGTAAADSHTVVRDNTDDSLPVTDELLLYVHGWFGNFPNQLISPLGEGKNEQNFEDLSSTLRYFEPDEKAVYTWSASDLDYVQTFRDTEWVGQRLAGLIEEFYDNGGGHIRLIGHSFGAPTVLHALNELDPAYTVETTILLAAANPRESLTDRKDWSLGWNFRDGVENNTDRLFNYHSLIDAAVFLNSSISFSQPGENVLTQPLGFWGKGPDIDIDDWMDVNCTFAPSDRHSGVEGPAEWITDEHFKYFDSDEIGTSISIAIEFPSSVSTPITKEENDDLPEFCRIENKNSDLVMDVSGISEGEGANVHQWEKLDQDNQIWKIESVDSGGYRIVVQHTGMVLAPEVENPESGTTLVQEEWRDSPHQRWLIQEVDGEFVIQNVASGLVADVEGWSTDNGGDIHLWEWHGDDNQRWNLTPLTV